MNLGVWHTNKSLTMQEMRVALKKKAEKGQATLSRKEANRTWREEILGILSDDQKKQRKAEKQENSLMKKRARQIDDIED